MKDYIVYLCIGASFDNRDAAYKLVDAFHQFLVEEVPVDCFEFQDVKLGFHSGDSNGKIY